MSSSKGLFVPLLRLGLVVPFVLTFWFVSPLLSALTWLLGLGLRAVSRPDHLTTRLGDSFWMINASVILAGADIADGRTLPATMSILSLPLVVQALGNGQSQNKERLVFAVRSSGAFVLFLWILSNGRGALDDVADILLYPSAVFSILMSAWCLHDELRVSS